jgi:hypothetical protein
MPERSDKRLFEFGPEPVKPRFSLARGYRFLGVAILLMTGVAVAAHYYLRSGPGLKWPQWLPQTALSPTTKVTRVFKWRDADGRWHVSDQRPGEGITYQTLQYRHDANIVPPPPESPK